MTNGISAEQFRALGLPTPRVLVAVMVATIAGYGVYEAVVVDNGPNRVTTDADLAVATVRKLTYEAFPQWAALHPGQCPNGFSDLAPYMGDVPAIDPWGTAYKFRCEAMAVLELFVRSAGEDRQFSSDDDLM